MVPSTSVSEPGRRDRAGRRRQLANHQHQGRDGQGQADRGDNVGSRTRNHAGNKQKIHMMSQSFLIDPVGLSEVENCFRHEIKRCYL